ASRAATSASPTSPATPSPGSWPEPGGAPAACELPLPGPGGASYVPTVHGGPTDEDEDVERPVRERASRPLQRRAADPQGAPEDGQGRLLARAESGVRATPSAEQGARRAARHDLREARQAVVRQDLQGDGRARRGGGGADRRGAHGRGARRRPDLGRAAGR